MLPNIFESIPEYSVIGYCTYLLFDLLTIAQLTCICNDEDYVDMSYFASERARDFGLLQNYSTSPSLYTFMSAVALEEIEHCLIERGKHFLISLAEKQIVIDGKKFVKLIH